MIKTVIKVTQAEFSQTQKGLAQLASEIVRREKAYDKLAEETEQLGSKYRGLLVQLDEKGAELTSLKAEQGRLERRLGEVHILKNMEAKK